MAPGLVIPKVSAKLLIMSAKRRVTIAHDSRGGRGLDPHGLQGHQRPTRGRARRPAPGRAAAARSTATAPHRQDRRPAWAWSTWSSPRWRARGRWRSSAVPRARPSEAGGEHRDLRAAHPRRPRPRLARAAGRPPDRRRGHRRPPGSRPGVQASSAPVRCRSWSSTPTASPPPGVASVGATNWHGGLAATRHLLELGHRRIGMISGPRRHAVQPRPHRRLPGGAGDRGRRGRPSLIMRRRLPRRLRPRPRPRPALAPRPRPPRSSRAATCRPSASSRRPGSAGCACPRT